MTPEFHPAAEAEFLDSIAFYESRKPGLGTSFLQAIHESLAFISEMPEAWPVQEEPDIRTKVVANFPYSIHFRIQEPQIQVLAVAHHKRKPGYWHDRLT